MHKVICVKKGQAECTNRTKEQAGVLILILKIENAFALKRASFRLRDSLTDRQIKTMTLALDTKGSIPLSAESAGRIKHNPGRSLPSPILSTCLHWIHFNIVRHLILGLPSNRFQEIYAPQVPTPCSI
jgi:hypothetical protein